MYNTFVEKVCKLAKMTWVSLLNVTNYLELKVNEVF